MPAHLRDIHVPKCNRMSCNKPATVELRNTWNATIGEFCVKHGNEALAEFQRKYEQGDTR